METAFRGCYNAATTRGGASLGHEVQPLMGSAETEPRAHPIRSLDIRLLGVVRVVEPDGSFIDLGGPKPTTVLVRLALDVGDVVSADSLVDTLWGERPPRTARRSLQAHVAKLRAALGADDGPLSSSGPGYVLDLTRENVDVLRIEDRLRTAQELAAVDPVRASELIAECRDNWSGEPFVDLADEPTLGAQRERLLRLKGAVDDAELEIQLAAGDPARAVVELERAVADNPTHEPNWIRLIKAYYASGRQKDALDAYRRAAGVLLEQLGVDPSPRLRDLEMQILRQDLDAHDNVAVCPYKGLVSYQITDGREFHGRSDTVDELINLVSGAPLGVVVGQSGVGKSSVLRAGLAYRVLTDRVPGIHTVSVITPGVRPMRSLFESNESADLLIVDQFEEIFTLSDDADRRDEFVAELIDRAAAGRTRVVLSVRADFYGHCLGLGGLSDALGRQQVNIGAMSDIGLREALVGPATQAGLEIEPELLEAVIGEVSNRPGALPLLSHALSETWRRRSGSVLTLVGYREAGSIAGAISATAERLHASLDARGHDDLERLFRRLVEPGDGTDHARRAVDQTELSEAGFRRDLVDRLVDARLLTASHDQVEIAHEALISAWPRLHEWIDSERDNIAIHQRLRRAAAAWFESERDEVDLYRGSKLDAALAWRQEIDPALTKREATFLEASDAQAHSELATQRRVNRRLRLLTAISATAMIAALIAGGVAVLRSRDADRRGDQLEVNQLATVIAADDTLSITDRLQSAVALHNRTPTSETAGLLFDSILRSPQVLGSADFEVGEISGTAPVGTGLVVLVEHEDGGPALFNALFNEVEEQEVPFTPAAILGGPNGTLAVHPTTFEVINLLEETTIGSPPPLAGTPSVATLSSDGEVLALGYDATEDAGAFVDVVNVSDGTVINRVELEQDDFGGISDLELNIGPQIRLLAVLDGFVAGLWDVGANEPLVRTSPEFDDPVAGGVISRRDSEITSSSINFWGDAFVLGRSDGVVELWRQNGTATWQRVARDQHHTAAVTWVEFDNADTFVASSAADGSVILLDEVDGSPRVGPIEFGTSGDVASYFHIATGDIHTLDSTGRSWTWRPQQGADLSTTVPAASGGQLNGTGTEWFGISDDRAVAVSGIMIRDLGADPGVIDVVMNRSGDYVLVYPDRVDWFRSDGDLVRSIEAPSHSINGRVAIRDDVIALVLLNRIVVMNSDGETIDEIDATESGEATRLDISDSGQQVIYSNILGELYGFSLETSDTEILLTDGTGHDGHFLADGRIVAVGSDGIQLIRIGADDAATVIGIARNATAIAFDDQRALAATIDDLGLVSLWNTDVGEQIGPSFLPSAGENIVSIGFTGSGELIVSAESSSVIVPTDPEDWMVHACTLLKSLSADHPLDERLHAFEQGCR